MYESQFLYQMNNEQVEFEVKNTIPLTLALLKWDIDINKICKEISLGKL